MAKLILIGSQELLFIAAKTFFEQEVELMLCIPESERARFNEAQLTSFGSVVFFSDIQSESLYAEAKAFEPDWILSIIFGQRIPAKFCQLASREALNFHPARLPDCRSGNTWFWPIRLGVSTSGISIHRLVEKWDAGDVLMIHPVALGPNDTQGVYYERIRNETAACVLALHVQMQQPTLSITPQPDSPYYPRLRIRDLLISWDESGESIFNLVRACNPNHYAETWFRNQAIQIVQVSRTQRNRHLAFHPDGTMVSTGELIVSQGELFCAAADIFLRIDVVLARDRACVSGPVFASLFNVRSGERFVDIATLTQFESMLDQKLL